MIELMVVVGILGLLLAIILPTATRVLENTKIKSTQSTLHLLETAMARFTSERPLGYTIYGYFPPPSFSTNANTAPTREGYIDSNTNGWWDWTDPITNDDGNKRYDVIYIRDLLAGLSKDPGFNPIITRNPPAGVTDSEGPAPYDTTDYLAIESFYLFVSQLSPQGKTILSKLALTNKDTCSGIPCPDVLVLDTNRNDIRDAADATLDLFEICDAWGRPFHYEVREVPGSTPARFEYEFRSAGPDGKFAMMFTPEDQSDDVVLKGQ